MNSQMKSLNLVEFCRKKKPLKCLIEGTLVLVMLIVIHNYQNKRFFFWVSSHCPLHYIGSVDIQNKRLQQSTYGNQPKYFIWAISLLTSVHVIHDKKEIVNEKRYGIWEDFILFFFLSSVLMFIFIIITILFLYLIPSNFLFILF